MFSRVNHKDDLKLRAVIIFLIMLTGGAILIVNLYWLQIVNAEKYVLLSHRNRIRLLPVLPKRGRIITADGKIVAGNNCHYKLVMERCSEKVFGENMSLLKQSIALGEDDLARIADQRKKRASFIVIKDGLSWDEYSRLSMILFRLNNVSIENTYIRNYMMPFALSHVLGYTSKSNGNIQILEGKTGLEQILNSRLSGTVGTVQVEVNATGKKVRIIDSQEPIDGEDVTISIDSQLQQYIYDIFSQERAGACVVLDISTGEILAMVSTPAFDPNLVSGKMTQQQWQSIIGDSLFPLMNRVSSCAYPPGSIFKIVVAFAALSEKVISPRDKIFCGGGVKIDNHVFHCWNRGGHGQMDLCNALKFSCDCYFFEVAKKLGIDTIVKYAKKFGFGAETGVELPNENTGLLPTKSWKILRYGTSWKPYETMIAGIGQGALLSTLLQSAVMFGKIYTENFDFSPTLIKNTTSKEKNPIDAEYLDVLKNALYQVCVSGTAARSCRTDYGISGKTGSSQVRKIKASEVGVDQKLMQWKLRDHAFFVGCAPYKNPKYVVAVLVEHGGGGATVAAPIARKIFDRLMKK
ncbi:MAG: penicillin-binding protein 2 [Holosporaceae bacterium]|jgi:penicillin-binding protein 2|nr:penicillin-binding protein 2 [Holosporaceae bacterium]